MKSCLAIVALAAALAAGAAPARAETVATFAVNEYFGVPYEKEPVSFDVALARPVPRTAIRASLEPFQVEVLEGTPEAVTKARVWVAVDFPYREREVEERRGKETVKVVRRVPGPGEERHKVVAISVDGGAAAAVPPPACRVEDAGEIGGLRIALVSNSRFQAKVPVGSKVFDPSAPPADLPGPVVSVSMDGKTWIGSGYLDTRRRPVSVTAAVENGPVYFESRLRYDFEGGRSYTARVRLFAAKPYAQLAETFDLGGDARFIFNYDDWLPPHFITCSDQAQTKIRPVADFDADDFIAEEGSRCLVRLVVWSQFGYFQGKSETVGLVTPDGAAAVGGFYVRPDLWTRAKVNHVDLYIRPEVPGDRRTRGMVGLKGARQRAALEAWLVDGRRQWALFAMPAGTWTEPMRPKTPEDPRGSEGKFEWVPALRKAHVLEGVWPLDRLLRTPLVWNSDGSPPALEDTVPGDPVGGTPGQVLLGMQGRSGLQCFNGSEGRLRGTAPPAAGWNGRVTQPVKAAPGSSGGMIDTAATAYFAADDSAYPSFRAMLPWTDPEALNPFYQGMENMNFNADLYRYVATYGLRLAAMGHPEAMRFIKHGEKSFDMALDHYVYPQSGCWEESHGYAGHTIGTVGPLVTALANSGLKDFREDVRFARMIEFFIYAHSPVDADFGNRVVPPIGDHGLSRGGPADRFGTILKVFTGAKNPEVQRIVRRAAWMIREDGGRVPDGVEPEKPDLSSRWLQGYGSVLRAEAGGARGLTLDLKGAIAMEGKDEVHDLTLNLVRNPDGTWQTHATGTSPTYNKARHVATIQVEAKPLEPRLTCQADVTVNADPWVKGGAGRYQIDLAAQSAGWRGTYAGSFNGRKVEGAASAQTAVRPEESFIVLRAGQSWGHHHADKGSLWGWFRNVHFFGDCAWGGPPGGTYWNQYKQGAPGHSEIEFVGINNWTLPCKYPAPWIADEAYRAADGFDYALARCLYPYNPLLDLSKSTPVALRSGYDRQVLFVHPDLVVVRDNVETVCPTIWRMHSYQPEGTSAEGGRATLKSSHGVTGELAILYPAGAALRLIDRDILNDKYHDAQGNKVPYDQLPKFGGSVELRWDMPPCTSATWTFAAHGAAEKAPESRCLDPEGRVTRVHLADGTEIVAMLNIEPFAWRGEGIDFEGTVGLVIRRGGTTAAHAIRAARLEAR